MKKDLLVRHIRGEATPQEERQVLDWVAEHPNHRQYYMDLKNLWVSRTLPQTRASAGELAAIRKRTTESLEIRYRRRGMWLYVCGSVAAVAAVAMLVLGITGFMERQGRVPDPQELVRVQLSDIPTQYMHEIYTEKGVKARVLLPDSSRVWLNSESRIVYPDKFIGSTREIEFSGEAYFDVRKNPDVPMMIKTNKDFTVKVLGTTFNLKSYVNDDAATATLYTGVIDIIAGKPGEAGCTTTRLKPSEKCIVRGNRAPELARIGGEMARKEIAWKDGKLIFDGTRMEEVVKMLRRWHGVEIIVEDPVILDYKITADFESESIVQIAEMLRYCALVDFKIADNKVFFTQRKK